MKPGMKLDRDKYIQIKRAQSRGARTLDEVKEIAGISINSEEEKHVLHVLTMACGCHKLSVDDVLKAIDNGADTMEKLVEATSIGVCCNKCTPIAKNILETRR